MKTRTLVIICISLVIAAVILMSGSCENGVTPSMEGTWVNSAYNASQDFYGKVELINNGDGTYTEKVYDNDFDTVPADTIIVTVTEETMDSEGNLFVKWEADYGVLTYILGKVHANNTTFEANWSETTYPTVIDSGDPNYNIYYRQ